MNILNKNSLFQTVDNFNEAHFYGVKIPKDEALRTINWLKTRHDTKYSYAKGFGLTEYDINSKVYYFTGDKSLTGASLRHIMAEEAARTYRLLNRDIGMESNEINVFEKNLNKVIEYCENQGTPEGWFCCGPCTTALWRYVNAGGMKNYSKKINNGLSVLKKHRQGNGEWRRFPLYYILLTLSEMKHPAAKEEIKYALKKCEKLISSVRTNTKFGKRRKDLLERILENN